MDRNRKAKAPRPVERRRAVRVGADPFLVAPGGRGNRRAATYAVCYVDDAGKTRYASTGQTAEKAARSVLAEWITSRAARASAGTVSAHLAAHLNELERRARAEGRDPARLANRRSALRLVEDHFGPLSPPAVKPPIVNAYVARRRADGVSDRTISLELASLRAGLNYAGEIGALEHAPKIRLPQATARARRRVLTDAELQRLMAALPGAPLHLRLFTLISIYTGQRGVHVRALRWEHVDLAGGWFRFEASNPDAASNKQTMDSRIPPGMRDALAFARRAARTPFVIEWDDKPVKSVKRSWATLCASAGLVDLHIHDLRRSFASIMARAGLPLEQIADHMNLDRRTLRLHYAHGSSSEVEQAVDRLADVAKIEALFDFSNSAPPADPA